MPKFRRSAIVISWSALYTYANPHLCQIQKGSGRVGPSWRTTRLARTGSPGRIFPRYVLSISAPSAPRAYFAYDRRGARRPLGYGGAGRKCWKVMLIRPESRAPIIVIPFSIPNLSGGIPRITPKQVRRIPNRAGVRFVGALNAETPPRALLDASRGAPPIRIGQNIPPYGTPTAPGKATPATGGARLLAPRHYFQPRRRSRP